MSALFENNILFLIEKTNLSRPNLVKLTESSRDFNLVLDSISAGSLEKEKLFNLSFDCFVKLLVFKYSKNYNNINFEDKLYIADAIIKNYVRLQKRVNFGYLSS